MYVMQIFSVAMVIFFKWSRKDAKTQSEKTMAMNNLKSFASLRG
jgi:hypothetical protein